MACAYWLQVIRHTAGTIFLARGHVPVKWALGELLHLAVAVVIPLTEKVDHASRVLCERLFQLQNRETDTTLNSM